MYSALGGLSDWLFHPIEAIKSRLGEFFDLPSRWQAMRVTAQAYASRGATADLRASGAELLRLLDRLDGQWAEARQMMRVSSGLGVLPIVWIGIAAGASAVGLVTLLWAVFSGDRAATDIVGMLERGELTAAQAKDIIAELPEGSGGPLSRLSGEAEAVLRLGLYGMGAWFVYSYARDAGMLGKRR